MCPRTGCGQRASASTRAHPPGEHVELRLVVDLQTRSVERAAQLRADVELVAARAAMERAVRAMGAAGLLGPVHRGVRVPDQGVHVAPWSGQQAIPMLRTRRAGSPPRRSGRRTPPVTRPAAASASAGCPRRAAAPRTRRRRAGRATPAPDRSPRSAGPISQRSRSPTRWPSPSLISLKRSRSMTITPSAPPSRDRALIACSASTRKKARLGRPGQRVVEGVVVVHHRPCPAEVHGRRGAAG